MATTAALLAAAAIGAGGSIYSAKINSQGAGGVTQATNPNNPILNQLLGVKKITHKAGDDAGTSEFVRNKKNPGLFGGQQFQDALGAYTYGGQGPTTAEQDLINQLTGGAGAALSNTQGLLNANTGRYDQLFGSAGNVFSQAAQPGFSVGSNITQSTPTDFSRAIDTAGQTAEIDPRLLETGFGNRLDPELLATGYRQSAQPLYNEAISQFQREALPELAERVGAYGGGLQSTGFQDSANRVIQNLLAEASRQDVALGESAAGRRATGQLAQGQLDDAASQRRALAALQQAGFIDAATARKAEALIREGELNFAAGESAKQRDLQRAGLQLSDAQRRDSTQLGALGLQGNFLGQQNQNALASLALGPTYASDILGLNQQLRGEQNALAKRPLDVFSQLSGLSTPPQLIQQGFNPQGSGTANLLGSFAGAFGGAGGGGNIFGVPNNPGGATGTPPINPGFGGLSYPG